MDYNTSQKKLVLPEYGRNIQKMVDHALSIEDRNERNRAAKTIISIMGNLNPHLRDISDFKHKLWDHLAIISDFRLDIDSPYELIDKNLLQEKPNKVDYNVNRIRYRHYGHTIEKLIHKAVDMQDEEEKTILLEIIANHMKKSYLTWNRETVDDNTIYDNIGEISRGEIRLNTEEVKLAETKDLLNAHRKRKRKLK
ncbi:MAG: DUF4290 domain-containing protein [bacterium]